MREALAGLGYGSEEVREALRELPAADDAADAAARRAASCSEPIVRDEFLDPGIGNDVEEADEAGLRPRRSPSSSASAS